MKLQTISGPPCPHCNNRHTVEVEPAEYRLWRTTDIHIQHAMPGLSADEREILISGMGPECWTAVFGEDDE